MKLRKTVTAVSLTAALAGSSLIATAGTAQAAGGCYVTASSATLRSKATTSSTAVGVAYRGNRCTERDYAYSGGYGWTKVTMTTGNAKGRTGWIRDDLTHTAAEDIGTCIPEDVACHH
ncbi:SH3 domain-containing protein [Streptomyces sp. NPDC006656]|uniref:SH3 domain-containing protein n=1 Tax=Streptomyces sp. NPDC006656 TaxID=3156899 RepID=UPI003452273A